MNYISPEKLDHILHFVQRPGRYIGEEINSVKKEFSSEMLKVVLCYPDLYEVGMSNFSLRILYEIINSENNLLAERVFIPEQDMQDILRKNNLTLFSLETKHFINQFDVLGFTVQYELNYLSLLKVLKLSQIPFLSQERDERFPFIIGGGAGITNPEPIADFFDFFLMGEAEDVIVDILNKIQSYKQQNLSKNEILKQLNAIDYLYVPALSKEKIKHHVVPDLNKVGHPVKQIVPYLEVVQNRGIVEIDRGCVNGCRFCQAGYYYRPKRERDVDKIVSVTETLVKNTGYDIITLLSLSVNNYSHLRDLLKLLNKKFKEKGVSFSLPSIRIDKFTLNLLTQLNVVRKSGLTFALETADQELQKGINKWIDLDNFIETLIYVAEHKWRRVKIYIMYGLTETEDEIEKIKELMDKMINKLSEKRLFIKINLHVTPLIRKPLTPFEKMPQTHFDIIREQLYQLKRIFLSKKYKRWIDLKWQNIEVSILETILARGDRKLSKVLSSLALSDDVQFNNTDLDPWLNTMSENNIDYHQYLYDKNYLGNPVWKKFDHGYKDDFFNEEAQKFLYQQQTQNCFDETCYDCGVCGDTVKSYRSKLGHLTVEPNTIQDLPKGRFRYKLVFTKKGLFKFISHRDLLPLFEKIFRMLDIPMLYSEGFNKRMRIRLIFPPPLMVEGENELLEFFTWKPVDSKELTIKINNVIQQKDLQVKEIQTLSSIEKPLNHSLQFSEYKILCKDRQCGEKIKEYLENENGIIYHLTTDKEIILTLKQDRSIIKLLNSLLKTELPELWMHIDKIIRLKIYK